MSNFFGFDTLPRIEKYNPGFNSATLSGCTIDTNGDVVLQAGTLVEQLVANSGLQAYGTNKCGQTFTTLGDITNFTIDVSLSRIATLQADVIFKVFATDVDGKPTGSALGTVTLPYTYVGTGQGWHTLTFTGLNLAGATKYALEMSTTAGDSINYYYWYAQNTDVYSGGTGLTFASDIWTVQTGYDCMFKAILGPAPTTGIVTEDISVSSLADWYKYYRKVTTPANTAVSCAIKDTSDNVLIASVADGDSLSTIDAKLYKTIRLVHTLTRVSISDSTPKLHYREVDWIGSEIDSKYGAVGTGTGSSINTELSITGGGCVLYSIANDGTAVTGTITRDGVVYQHFTFPTGAMTLTFGKGLKCNKSLLITASVSGKLHINYGY